MISESIDPKVSFCHGRKLIILSILEPTHVCVI